MLAWAIPLMVVQYEVHAQGSGVHSASSYKYVVAERLQFFGRPYTFLPSISPEGAVAGTLSDLGKTIESAVWYQGRYTRVGAGWAVAVNDYDLVAGEISVPDKDGIPRSQAALFNKGKVTEIANAGGYNDSIVGGINDAGSVVGSFNYYDSSGNNKGTLGFLYQNGGVTVLGSPIPNQKASVAAAINNSGLIVGAAVFPTGRHAATYSSGQWNDLGTIGPAGSGSGATSVNNQGWIVGTFESADNALNGCFLYKDGKMTNLDLPNASPDDPQVQNINDQGQIVATAPPVKDNGFGVAGYLYDNGQWTQIDTLLNPTERWSIVRTYGISNAGAIVAQGIQVNSKNIEVYNGTVLIEPVK